MINLNNFILERLKLNKNSKISKTNRIIVFPKSFTKEALIRKFISDLKSRECGEIQTKKTLWSIYIIIGSENIEKFKDLINKPDNKDMFCIYKFLPDMNLNNLRNWWENTKTNFESYKDVIEFLDDNFDGYKLDILDI